MRTLMMWALVLAGALGAGAQGTALTVRGGEDTWIGAAAPHTRHGGEAVLPVGAPNGVARALVRFELRPRLGSYTAVTAATLALKLVSVQGNWTAQAFDLYRVADANGRWGADSATWASAADTGIIMLGTGEPIRTRWDGPAGLDGRGLGARVATATISAGDAGTVIRFTITDPAFLKAWADDPAKNAGFLLKAPGLEMTPGASAQFAALETPRPDDRPALALTVAGFTPPRAVLSYTLPTAGQVSLIIFDAQGTVVRELLHGAPRAAGKQEDGWDGKDEQGADLPAGAYRWKLLVTQGLQAEYLLTLGTNPTPGWERWPGNHNPVITVAQDDSGVYYSSGSCEGPEMLVKDGPDGTRQWGIDNFSAFGGAPAIVADNGKLFLIESGSKKVMRLDAASGKRELTFDAMPAGNHALLHMDLSARNGRVAVSYLNQQRVRWFDADGKALGEAAVPHPAGLTLEPDGTAVVISEGQLVRVAPGGTPTPLVAAGKLVAPWRIDRAPNGDLLVAESDEMLNWALREAKLPVVTIAAGTGRQMKRFAANGTFKAAYGEPGGRPKWGKYQPEKGFGNLLDITVATDGSLYATDLHGPARTMHLTADGKLLREWYGGQTYGCSASADPADPSKVYLNYGWGGIIQYRVDYVKKTWVVESVIDTNTPMWKGDANFHLFVRHRNGKTYFCTSITPSVFEVDEVRGTLKPMSVLSFPLGGGPEPNANVLAKMKPNGQWKNFVFNWADINGDYIPQDDEFTMQDYNFRGGGMYVDDNFNYYLGLSGNVRTYAKLDIGYVKLSPQGVTPTGAPIYNNLKQERLGEPPMNRYHFGSFGDEAIWRDDDGSVYVIYNTNNEKRFGQGFWSPRTGGNRVARWDADGKLAWVVGRHSATGGAAPGEGRYFWRIMGTTHGCVVVGDMENSLQHVWDQDGLWVGRLLEHPVNRDLPPHVFQLCGEQFGGSLYTDPKSGDVLFYGSGMNNVPVFRITGWDKFQRQQGAVALP